jgi:hypothetical protein
LNTPETTPPSIPTNLATAPAEALKKSAHHPWEHTTDVAKVVFAKTRVLFTDAPSVAFTLNLSPDQIAAANDNPEGPDHFKRRFSRSLKAGAWLPSSLLG